MMIPILVALVSVIGLYIAATTTAERAAERTLKTELQKLQYQLRLPFAQELWKQRFENYQKFYGCLYSLNHDLNSIRMSHEMLQRVYVQLRQTGSECALFFGDDTSKECDDYIRKIRLIASVSDEKLKEYGKMQSVIDQGEKLMEMLKKELQTKQLHVPIVRIPE